LRTGVEAAQPRHGDFEDDDIRLERRRYVQQFAAVGCATHYVAVRFEQGRKCFSQ
jgi:hypothetical protein